MYGSPMNFNGSTGESHLKSKTKQPARRTRMRDVDVEYMTAMKDYENIVLERGLAEIESYRKKAAPSEPVKHRLGRRYYSFWDQDGNIRLRQERVVKNHDIFADWKSDHFTCDHLYNYLEEHDLVDVLMYTEYNHPGTRTNLRKTMQKIDTCHRICIGLLVGPI